MRKITFWLSLVLIFMIPWEDSINIGTVGSLARLMGFAVAGFWLLTILAEGRFRQPHFFHLVVLLFFLWNGIGMIWTLDSARTQEHVITYGQIFLLALIVWEICKEPADLMAGLQAYVLGGYVSIASTVINYARGSHISTYELRYSASGVNAVELAVILILGIPIAWHLFVNAKNARQKRLLSLINLAYIPLAVFATILTGSRTSLFTMAPVIVYILWSRQVKLTKLIPVLMILSVSMLVLYFYLPQSVVARFGTTAASFQAADLSGRVDLWRGTIQVFLEHPILGSGSGALTTILGSPAHQTFLSVMAETGLIGSALFLSVLAVVFWQAVNLPKGYSALWLTVLVTWAIGVSSLSWEVRKPTWLIMSFVVIEGSLLHERLSSQKAESGIAAGNARRSLTDVDEQVSAA